MKAFNLILLTVACCSYFSCSQHEKKDQKQVFDNGSDTVHHIQPDTLTDVIIDTLYGSYDSIKIRKTKYYITPPPVTPLPFGIKVTLKNFTTAREFFANLESGRGNVLHSEKAVFSREVRKYKLPPIAKVNFISVDGANPSKCADGKLFGEFLKLSVYQHRLPDINKYQCFYFTEFDGYQKYPDNIRTNCIVYLDDFYVGYLILYHPITKEANVIKVYNDAYVDGMALHTFFYIDKSQNITLTIFSAPSDDEGDDPDHPDRGNDVLISISKKGEIVVK